MSDRAFIGVSLAAVIFGVGTAAFILRWEIRYQLRQRRYGGFVGGER